MTKQEEYREIAANCLRVSDQMTDPAAKASFVAMARVWHDLAEQAERNSRNDVVYEPPLRERSEQPVAQQQQQIQPGKDEPES